MTVLVFSGGPDDACINKRPTIARGSLGGHPARSLTLIAGPRDPTLAITTAKRGHHEMELRVHINRVNLLGQKLNREVSGCKMSANT